MHIPKKNKKEFKNSKKCLEKNSERDGCFIYIEITVLSLGELGQLEKPLYLRGKRDPAFFFFCFVRECFGGCWKSWREMILTVHSMLQFSSVDFYPRSGLMNE